MVLYSGIVLCRSDAAAYELRTTSNKARVMRKLLVRRMDAKMDKMSSRKALPPSYAACEYRYTLHALAR
jgi:hypothetical protein